MKKKVVVVPITVGTLGTANTNLVKYKAAIRVNNMQKTVLSGIARILRKALEK